MNTVRRATAVLTTGALLAVPTAVLVASPAHADVERRGVCGGGTYELSVDREDGGFEVGVDLDRVAPGSTWRVVLRHDGKRVVKTVRTADREGDVEVERLRRDTAGSDTFFFRATRVGTGVTCSAKITV